MRFIDCRSLEAVWDAAHENHRMQLHAEIRVPKGQYWLRTGVYDQASHKVGTLEVPLAAVVEAQK